MLILVNLTYCKYLSSVVPNTHTHTHTCIIFFNLNFFFLYLYRYHEGMVYVIDVSQSVEHDHPRAADFLRKDCTNITGMFLLH